MRTLTSRKTLTMDAYDEEAVVAQAERHLVTAQYAQCEELAAALLQRAARSRGEDGGSGRSAPPRFITDAGYMLLQVLHVTDRCVRSWLVGGSRGWLSHAAESAPAHPTLAARARVATLRVG